MKAISLTQPWATLVAIGAKKIETRSWSTGYRGNVAIHASKTFPRWAQELCYNGHAIGWALKAYGVDWTALPKGAILCVCDLTACIRVEDASVKGTLEEWFGDYTPGRYAWRLANVRSLPEPIPAKGSLGLWEFPDDVLLASLERV